MKPCPDKKACPDKKNGLTKQKIQIFLSFRLIILSACNGRIISFEMAENVDGT